MFPFDNDFPIFPPISNESEIEDSSGDCEQSVRDGD